MTLTWDDLRYLLAVHRMRTHAGAGKLLGVNATTVARRLAVAEEALGARLVERVPEGLRLTEAGTRAVNAAERAEEAIGDLQRGISGEDARMQGTVRITSGDGMLGNVLAPALPRLFSRHPDLRIELIAATRPLDLRRREADIAVRLFRPEESSLVARKLAPLPYGLFASPAYLAKAGAPRSTEDLARHDWVVFDAALDATPEMEWVRRHVSPERFVVRCSSTPLLFAACRAGLGLVAVARSIAATEPDLVPVLPRVQLPVREAWAVHHPDLRGNARIRAVLDWMTETLSGKPAEMQARPSREPRIRARGR